MKFRLPASLWLLSLALAGPLRAAPIAVSETTLANGLRVVVYENHSTPVVAVNVWYRIGAYFERSGHTGLSHLLEHMMFKGTKRYPAGVYSKLIEQAGGTENAFTSDNYTVYWAELAADRYELEMKLEADRMQNLLLDSLAFLRERNVVMEERRLSENSPSSALWEDFFAAAFKIHPSRNPVIGWMEDLTRLTRSDIVRHYRTYYVPNNAVLVVAGDVRPATIFAQAVQHFGRIKPGPVPHWSPVEPAQLGEKTLVIRKEVSTPALMIGWRVPGIDDPDYYALDVIEALLLRGRVSRLHDRLVYRQGLALEVWGGNDVEKDPGLFYVFADARDTVRLDSVNLGIRAELENLTTVPVRDSELVRVKNQVLADFIFRQDKSTGMARQVGRSVMMYGSVDFLNRYPDRLAAVTPEDIMRAARKYFVTSQQTLGRLLPAAPAREEK